jgi:hypothetical protein
MPLDEVYDRFEAQRKWARKVVVRSSAAALLVGLAVLTWYYSDIGFHQVSVFRGEGSDYYPVLGGFTGSTDDEFVSFHVRHLHKWHIRNPDNSERVEIDGVPTQAVVADATTAVIARGSELFRLDFGSGQTTLLFQVRQPIREIAVANNQWVVGSGERMFVGTMDGQVRQAPSRFNIRGSFQELRYGERVVFCSNGRWVANAALSGNLVVLNPDTWGWFDSNNPVVYSAPDNRNITALVCDEKSRRLFFFERPRGIGVFSFDDGQVRKLNTPEIGFVDHAAVTPGGEYLMAKTGTTLHWFQRNGEEYAHVDQQNGDASNLTNLLASPSGSFFLASGYRDHATLYKRTLRMFNIDLPIPWQ